MTEALRVSGLIKSYGERRVLTGVSFAVQKGEIFGILGVNGAGKTTLLECVEGFLNYEEGSVSVNGRMGVQLQSASLPGYITAEEAMRLFARWKRVRADEALFSLLGTEKLRKKRYMELSAGQKRRLHLALALIGDPGILFLDEPGAGLDVEGRLALHAELRRLKDAGKTIVLTSHDMAEVESLCGRIAILDGGRIAFLGSADALAESVGRRYTITVRTKEGEERILAEDIGESLLGILEEYKRKGLSICDLKVDRGTLEEHFMDFVNQVKRRDA